MHIFDEFLFFKPRTWQKQTSMKISDRTSLLVSSENLEEKKIFRTGFSTWHAPMPDLSIIFAHCIVCLDSWWKEAPVRCWPWRWREGKWPWLDPSPLQSTTTTTQVMKQTWAKIMRRYVQQAHAPLVVSLFWLRWLSLLNNLFHISVEVDSIEFQINLFFSLFFFPPTDSIVFMGHTSVSIAMCTTKTCTDGAGKKKKGSQYLHAHFYRPPTVTIIIIIIVIIIVFTG